MEIVEWIKSLLIDHGAVNVIIMALVIVITNIIKKPIVAHADEFAATAKKLTGLDIDKRVITSNIIYIPIGVAFVLYFIYTLFAVEFVWSAIAWRQMIADSVVYGMLSMTCYDIGKSKLQAYINKADYNTAKNAIKEAEQKEKDLLVQETTDELK